MKELLSGNEAIARGAYEAGVNVATGYPGTPSTEILEAAVRFLDDIYCQWSPNEKVALEVAAGAAFTGARAIATMKHVGLNVAADPLMTLAGTGTVGGLVIVVADDPGMHSSQNARSSSVSVARNSCMEWDESPGVRRASPLFCRMATTSRSRRRRSVRKWRRDFRAFRMAEIMAWSVWGKIAA